MKKLAIVVSMVVLGAVTALAGTISVPQFNDAGGAVNTTSFFPTTNSATFIALKNNTATTKTYTLLYYSLEGTNRTPTNNSFTIAGNAARGWRPVASDAGGEGTGQSIPDATGAGGSGSVSILYVDSPAPSGRVFVNAAATLSSFGYALFPAL